MSTLKDRTEYIRHLNTLSTGSIIIIATFLKDVFKDPGYECIVIFSLSGFIGSVCGAVSTYTIEILTDLDETSGFMYYLDKVSTFIMWIGFLIGIISLAIFAILNISLLW